MEQRSTQPDSTQHRSFNVGDRVRIVESKSPLSDRLIGMTGDVTATEPGGFLWVRFDRSVSSKARIFRGMWVLPDELEAVRW